MTKIYLECECGNKAEVESFIGAPFRLHIDYSGDYAMIECSKCYTRKQMVDEGVYDE